MKRTMIAIAVAATACASTRAEKSEVSAADLGRLSPEQMGPVDEARQARATAVDEEARARLRQQEAQHERDLAQADVTAADASAQQAEAQSKIANETRRPDQLERASRLQERARAQKEVATAHLEYANRLFDARQAEAETAAKQIEFRDARLEKAKLDAMRQAKVPASSAYDTGRFQSRVHDSQQSYEEARKQSRELDGQATSSQRRWKDLQRQFQAKGRGAAPTG